MSDEDVLRARRVLRRHGIDTGDVVLQITPDHYYGAITVEADGMRRRSELAIPRDPEDGYTPIETTEAEILRYCRPLFQALRESQ